MGRRVRNGVNCVTGEEIYKNEFTYIGHRYGHLSTTRLVGSLPSHISPTRTRGIIVKYILRKLNQTSVKIELLIQNIVSIDLNLRFNNISLLLGNFRNCISS